MNKLSRREFFVVTALASSATMLDAQAKSTLAPGLHLRAKDVFVPSKNGTGVFPGFITYIHKRKKHLLHRYGWVDASDTYDNFHESISKDNGKTWSEPELVLKSIPVDGGLIRYIENAAYFDQDRGELITFVSKFFYPDGKFDSNQPRKVMITRRNPKSGKIIHESEHDFGQRGGMGCSFCFPIKTKSGRLVVPGFSARVNEQNEFVNHPVSGINNYDTFMMLGEYTQSGDINWTLSEAIQADDDQSTRGLSESALVQLNDGRLAILCRGSNYKRPESPGHKWLCYSEDEGMTWSKATPMTCADGSEIQSAATGSALFRSIKNDKLYFIGNLCADGKPANGNWPRSPLHIAEVDETTVSIKRETITVIDERGADDGAQTQISNFRYYQDRKNGDIVLYATRFGENKDKVWKEADYYQYRISIV
jgi:hypothetical protein